MRLQAEVSWYPLKTMDVTQDIVAFLDALRAHDVEIELGPLSALVRGEADDVFHALHSAYLARALHGTRVMVVKYVNL